MGITQNRTRSPKTDSSQALSPETVFPRAQQAPQITSLSGCLVRLCWMAFGNAALYLMAAHMFLSGGAVFSALDLAFWGTVVLLIAIRYWDIRKLNGLTAGYEPATMAHWGRYAVGLTVVSFVLWALARGAAYLGT